MADRLQALARAQVGITLGRTESLACCVHILQNLYSIEAMHPSPSWYVSTTTPSTSGSTPSHYSHHFVSQPSFGPLHCQLPPTWLPFPTPIPHPCVPQPVHTHPSPLAQDFGVTAQLLNIKNSNHFYHHHRAGDNLVLIILQLCLHPHHHWVAAPIYMPVHLHNITTHHLPLCPHSTRDVRYSHNTATTHTFCTSSSNTTVEPFAIQ